MLFVLVCYCNIFFQSSTHARSFTCLNDSVFPAGFLESARKKMARKCSVLLFFKPQKISGPWENESNSDELQLRDSNDEEFRSDHDKQKLNHKIQTVWKRITFFSETKIEITVVISQSANEYNSTSYPSLELTRGCKTRHFRKIYLFSSVRRMFVRFMCFCTTRYIRGKIKFQYSQPPPFKYQFFSFKII